MTSAALVLVLALAAGCGVSVHDESEARHASDLGTPDAPDAGVDAAPSPDHPTRRSRYRKVSPLSGASSGGEFPATDMRPAGLWSPVDAGFAVGDTLAVPLPVEAGDRIEAVRTALYGNTGVRIVVSLHRRDDAFSGRQQISESVGTALSNTRQTIVSMPQPTSSTTTKGDVTSGMDVYWIEYRALRSYPSEGMPIVGPIVVEISSIDP